MKSKKTTTFPLKWDQVKRLENQLLINFLELRDLRSSVDLVQITLGCRFGLRVSDLLQIRWGDLIDTPIGEDLLVTEKKTNKLRMIRMTSKVKTVTNQVTRIMNVNPESFIFTSNKGKGNFPMSTQNFNRRLRTTLEVNNIRFKGNPSSHLLRKSFVVGTIQHGFKNGDHLSLIKVSHLINHSSVNQTIRYTNYETSEMMGLYELD